METQITISRTSPQDIQLRQVIVSLDQTPWATLKFGDSVTRPLSPGHHRLRVDNTFHKKAMEFDVAEGEQVHFAIINRVGRFSWLLVAFFGAGPMYVSITRV